MAHLRDTTGAQFALLTHHLIGRSRSMHTVLTSADVSAQHLAIAWNGKAWTVRDLASRNGTVVDGRRLEAGEIAELRAGSVIEVGNPSQRLQLVDDDAPAPRATHGDTELEGHGELLAIPSADEPLAVVMFDPDEGWLVSHQDETRSVRDGQEIVVQGTPWRLSLPQPLDQTAEARRVQAPSDTLAVHFRVSSDEEYVELTVQSGQGARALPARAHHYLLLTLGRARLNDAALPESERGWMYTSELQRMLRISSNQLYVSIHRARKELEAAVGVESATLIERRPTTHQIRLGVPRIRVELL